MQGPLTGMRLFSIPVMGVLPLLLMVLVTSIEAKRQAEKQANAASEIVLRNVETIFDHAVSLTESVAGLAALPCEQVEGQLQRLGSLEPYVRALLLARESTLYCSSATGASQQRLSEYTKRPGPLPLGKSWYLLPGTPTVPDRAAIVGALGLDDERGVIATVDGQYLLDLLAATSPPDRFSIAVQVEGSDAVLAGPGGSPLAVLGLETLQPLKSTRYPLIVYRGVQPQLIDAVRNQLLVRYTPFTVLLSLLLAYAAYRYHMQRMSIVAEIRRAMANDEFHVHYQPVIDLDTQKTSGVEALMRWNKPGSGPVRPDVFFAVAEDNGLALSLTRHLFRLIHRDLHGMPLPPGFHIGVNITGEHLASPDMIADIHGLQEGLRTTAPKLVLEITERKVVPDTDLVLSNMRTLRKSGVQFAIDDFGTGHSSLAYLEKFPVDYIKIDRGFVSVIDTDAVSAPVLETIISLGARLDVTLIAEGIETEVQATYLRGKGVKFAQGFLFSRPISAEALQSWIRDRQPGDRL